MRCGSAPACLRRSQASLLCALSSGAPLAHYSQSFSWVSLKEPPLRAPAAAAAPRRLASSAPRLKSVGVWCVCVRALLRMCCAACVCPLLLSAARRLRLVTAASKRSRAFRAAKWLLKYSRASLCSLQGGSALRLRVHLCSSVFIFSLRSFSAASPLRRGARRRQIQRKAQKLRRLI